LIDLIDQLRQIGRRHAVVGDMGGDDFGGEFEQAIRGGFISHDARFLWLPREYISILLVGRNNILRINHRFLAL